VRSLADVLLLTESTAKEQSNVDEVLRCLQGAFDEASFVRFRPL
jgi:hypothetical protein